MTPWSPTATIVLPAYVTPTSSTLAVKSVCVRLYVRNTIQRIGMRPGKEEVAKQAIDLFQSRSATRRRRGISTSSMTASAGNSVMAISMLIMNNEQPAAFPCPPEI